MAETIFWSWQSDLDARVTREVVRFALDEALKMLAADLEEADRPSITSDTQGVAGTPDIVATILRKIDEAAVFVGDVTPIATSATGKACANPNVLLEMGYANKALSPLRVIQVWNTAFDGAEIDKLPFDMRGRRGPIAFHLPPGSGTDVLRAERTALAGKLAAALKLALGTLPAPEPDAVHWQPHAIDDVDLWFDRTAPQTVTNPQHGSHKFIWKDHYPGYARLIPSKWNAHPDARASLASADGHPALVANANALNFGMSRGGAAVYWPRGNEDGVVPTMAVTQWFEKTGEFWGVGAGFLFSRDGRISLATGSFFRQWLHFLKRNVGLALHWGGTLPIHVRLGVNGLADSWWPRGRYDFDEDGFAAVEDSFEYQATLHSADPDDLKAVAVDAFNGLAAVYGQAPYTAEQIFAFER